MALAWKHRLRSQTASRPATEVAATWKLPRADEADANEFADLRASNAFSLFADDRGQLGGVYALVCLENGLRVAQPFVIGLAINDLLGASYRGLLLFVIQHLAFAVSRAARQMAQTRLFVAMRADVAVRFAQTSHEDDQSEPATRCDNRLCWFEETIPHMLQTVIWLAGSLVMLGGYDLMLVPLCLLLVLPFVLLNAAYGRQMSLMTDRIDDELAREDAILATEDRPRIRRHLDSLTHWRVRLSDAQAIKVALSELFVLGLLATALVHYCANANGRTGTPTAAGDIFAVVSYLWLFVVGLNASELFAERRSVR